jgi:glucose-1-phosphate thymidylyltransferase
MKGLILAAGYATRLRPLTDSTPKMLLPVGGRPVLDWIWDKLLEVRELDELHLVTNARYATQFEHWAEGREIVVHDDGTTSNEDRLGALGDIALVLDRADWEGEDVLVVAGDNLFDFSLADFVAFWKEHGGSALAVYEHPVRELASNYGVVELDPSDRVAAFVEKPANPPSNLVATATYGFDRAHLALLHSYLADSELSRDAPGNFVAWLHSRAPVYGFRFAGEWLDIGDLSQLRQADERYSGRTR